MKRLHGLAVKGVDGLVHWDSRASSTMVDDELVYLQNNNARFYIDCVWYATKRQGPTTGFVSTNSRDVSCLQCLGLTVTE